jgi:enamine deaminase RidA (YjgF/YER057c/UK114 family)
MRIEAKLAEMGLVLPAPMQGPPGFRIAWSQVRVIGDRAIIAGHGPRLPDGSFAGPPGKVGSDLTLAQGRAAARAAGLAILGDLSRELGDLDRVINWVRIYGMVNAAPGFVALAPVIDGFTELMIDLFGEEAALCPRSVAGMAELAFNSPVIIEGEVQISRAM